MKIEIITYQPKAETVLERINKTQTVYLCFSADVDDGDDIQFGTASYSQAHQFARMNNCVVSEYPKGRLSL